MISGTSRVTYIGWPFQEPGTNVCTLVVAKVKSARVAATLFPYEVTAMAEKREAHINLRIEPALAARAKKLAQEHHTTVAALIRTLLKRATDPHAPIILTRAELEVERLRPGIRNPDSAPQNQEDSPARPEG